MSRARTGCRSVAPRLSAWLDGETTDRGRPVVERHIARCGSCAAEVDRLAAARAAMQELLADARTREATLARWFEVVLRLERTVRGDAGTLHALSISPPPEPRPRRRPRGSAGTPRAGRPESPRA